MAETFENLKDALPPVFRKGVSFFERLWSGDSTRELEVQTLTGNVTGDLTGDVEAENITTTDLTTDSVQFDTDAVCSSLAIGERAWCATNKTTKLGLAHGSSLLDGQELLEPVFNDTGGAVTNGQAVYFSTTEPISGFLTIGLTRPDLHARIAGLVTTDSIADDGEGWVVTYGVAHDVPITGLTLGLPIFADPTVPGGLTNTDPEWPEHIIFIGGVTKDNGDGTGDIRVDPYIVQREVPTPVVLTYSSPTPERDAEENVHGGIWSIVTGHDLDAGDLTLTGATAWGIGKMIIVVNAGTDLAGDITVTGTQVDRNTGVETPAQTSTITVDALTTDGSGTDTNGYEFHDLQHAYITDKWFSGSADIVVSSADTVLTDIDVYQVSFEQFNDAKYIELTTADMNYLVSATAPMSAYIYTVEVVNDVVNLTMQGSHIQSAAEQTADRAYRIRRGNMGIELDGSTDGVFLTIRMGGINKFRDVGIKVWGNVLYT